MKIVYGIISGILMTISVYASATTNIKSGGESYVCLPLSLNKGDVKYEFSDEEKETIGLLGFVKKGHNITDKDGTKFKYFSTITSNGSDVEVFLSEEKDIQLFISDLKDDMAIVGVSNKKLGKAFIQFGCKVEK